MTLANGGEDFGSGIFHIVQAEQQAVDRRILGLGPFTINSEGQLLLLALFIGACAASVYALKTLADYRGDHLLYGSWFTFYLIQPFEGAGAAFLLYLVIRGGFLTGTGGEKAVNQFGVCAIAALGGAFSDKALLKLRRSSKSYSGHKMIEAASSNWQL